MTVFEDFGREVVISGNRLAAASMMQFGGPSGGSHAFEFAWGEFREYGFGDGVGTTCPCGNESLVGTTAGCTNSRGAGARLTPLVGSSASPDELVMSACNLIPGQPALLFTGESELLGGWPLFDGSRVAGGFLVRRGIETPDSSGFARWGPGIGVSGGGWLPGMTRYFQVWYRDPAGPCGSGANLTNGVEVTFH